MAKHKKKFEPIEEYKEIAKSITIIDIHNISIIDTCSKAKKIQKMDENFIYVSCSKDFDVFKIESDSNKETVSLFFNQTK
jgi:hypothetical protein